MSLEHRDRVLDWRIELQRLEPELSSLPPAARLAVDALVQAFGREDDEQGDELCDRLHDAA